MPWGRRLILVAALFGCAPAGGAENLFRIIDSPQQAAQVRADLIRQAGSEIAIELFRTTTDRSGLAYLTLLREAARRGVRVRLLVDAFFNAWPKGLQAHLVQEGVEIKEYHPFKLTRPAWVTRRLHDKLFLRDRSDMLVGGRNLENPFFGIAPELGVHTTYVDRDVYVQGEVVGAAAAYFDRLWASGEVRDTALGIHDPKRLRQPCDPSWDEQSYGRCETEQRRVRADLTRFAALLDTRRAELEQGDFVDLQHARDWSARAAPARMLSFHHDPVGAKGKRPGTFEALLALLAGAEHAVLIESPYLVLSERMRTTLTEIIARGVRVRVLTNSLAVSQNLYAQASYELRKRKLLALGLEIWEYKGPSMLHAKSIVIDDRVAIVGNFNIDPRSEKLNTELAVVARDQQAAARLRASMERNLANAWRIGPDGKAVGELKRFPGVGVGKIMKLRLHQLLLPLIEGQL